jgi:hypothetical protein
MYGYLIVVKIVAKTRLNCKCYKDSQKMNMYILTIYIIHSPFNDVMLSHDLQLNVKCNFIYATKTILVVNVDCKRLIVINWNHNLTFFI